MKNKKTEKSIFDINVSNLDEAWLRQSSLVEKYGKMLASRKRDLDRAEAKLELVEAEQAKRIHRNPEKFGLESVTVKGVEQAVILTKEYQKAKEDVIDMKYKLGVTQAMISGLSHLKKALEELFDMWAMSYLSTPKASPQWREAIQHMEKSHARMGRKKEDNDDDD